MGDSATGSGVASGAASGAAAGTAILPGWGTVIGAVIGGVVGGIGGAGVDQAQTRLKNTINQYMEQMAAIDMPRYEDLKVVFQKSMAGEPLTPQQLTALQDVNSEVQKIYQDKASKQTQLEAIAAMKQRSRGGLTLQDKADLLQAQREIDRQQSGVQKSILSNMQQRGQLGSGAELAARLSAGQSGAQQASQNALNIAAQSRAGAIQALKDSAAMGRQMGQDQLGFDKMKADAADETRRSNLTRLQNAMQYNVGNINAAKQFNINRQNKSADQNVDLSNQEQVHNKGVLWNDYLNQIGQLQQKYLGKYGEIGQKEGSVEDAQNQADSYNKMMSSVGSMAGGMSGSGGGMGGMTSMFGSGGSTPGGNSSSIDTSWGNKYGG